MRASNSGSRNRAGAVVTPGAGATRAGADCGIVSFFVFRQNITDFYKGRRPVRKPSSTAHSSGTASISFEPPIRIDFLCFRLEVQKHAMPQHRRSNRPDVLARHVVTSPQDRTRFAAKHQNCEARKDAPHVTHLLIKSGAGGVPGRLAFTSRTA